MTDPVRNPFLPPDPNGSAAVGNVPHAATGSGDSLLAMVRAGQILTFALAQGVIVVGVFLWFFLTPEVAGEGPAVDVDLPWLFPAVGTVAALTAVSFAIVVAPMLRRGAVESYQQSGEQPPADWRAQKLLGPAAYQMVKRSFTFTLISQALLEGAAVMNLIFFMFDAKLLHLALAAACVIGIAVQTPTMSRWIALIEQPLGRRQSA